jgi:hypothetical protein
LLGPSPGINDPVDCRALPDETANIARRGENRVAGVLVELDGTSWQVRLKSRIPPTTRLQAAMPFDEYHLFRIDVGERHYVPGRTLLRWAEECDRAMPGRIRETLY